MGGRYKGGDFGDLRDAARARAIAIVAIGEAAPLVEDALADAVPVTRAATMADAVRAAFAKARPGGIVLLAPACSSFDMFVDYADRGDQFRAAVKSLVE
jgi:UDP-N-acetylmuramoylalanine--D-glutamate ligase